MQPKVASLHATVSNVRKQADKMLGEALKPLQDWLNKLAQRLDVEHRLNYQASTNALNPHTFGRFSFEAEIEALRKTPPPYVKVGKEGVHPALAEPPMVPRGHFDIGANAPRGAEDAFKTFAEGIRADRIPPGTVLYRVLDPKSADNSICWMSKTEFDKLRSKAAWRDRFAVWRHWNHNGEYVTYTVPPGQGLPVWRGPTASQQLTDRAGRVVKADDKGNGFWLTGGAEQIVVNPADLQRTHMGKRQFTGWGYDEGDVDVSLVGVPILQNYWR